MSRWLRSLFAWREVRWQGVWRYDVNDITGQRRAVRESRCFQPLDLTWLRSGDVVIDPFGRKFRETLP